MENMSHYSAHYEKSHALIIGVNEYLNQSRLDGCVHDAKAVLQAVKPFGFDSVATLFDADANKRAILQKLTHFSEISGKDDRFLIFFAGHGFVKKGHSKKFGFLVPFDGDVSDHNTLISWSYLIEQTEFISAKHIFFIIDACFSGLIFSSTRESTSSSKGVTDAISNFARQAISSGKSYQPVDDSGGALQGHSLFASHLIRGLNGEAFIKREPLTASALCAFLLRKVGNDPKSNQTPEYGKLKGEGDFVFNPPMLEKVTWCEPDDRDPEVVVHTLWRGRISDDFLIHQQNLDVFLKDGHSFFKQRASMLRQRLADPAKTTRIIIVHPDFVHIEAVGAMDAAKKLQPGQQRLDCIGSILTVQEIALETERSDYDPRRCNLFRGCDVIPTWNGFIGDRAGLMNLYFSRPHRGPLNAIVFQDGDGGFFSSIKEDFEIILRTTTDLWGFAAR